jgi:hypothetical protein
LELFLKYFQGNEMNLQEFQLEHYLMHYVVHYYQIIVYIFGNRHPFFRLFTQQLQLTKISSASIPNFSSFIMNGQGGLNLEEQAQIGIEMQKNGVGNKIS